MYIKNTASQHVSFVLVKASDGTALTGATVTKMRSIDGGAQGAADGTVTELGGGQYDFAMSQADTNGDTVGYLFTAATAIPVNVCISFFPAAIPTAVENADALLKRDWTSVTGEAARSVLNALRFLRNKWSIAATTLTVTKEDDAATAWTAAVTTQTSTEAVTAVDPA